VTIIFTHPDPISRLSIKLMVIPVDIYNYKHEISNTMKISKIERLIKLQQECPFDTTQIGKNCTKMHTTRSRLREI